ncbi:hypothetical protein LZ554_004759 [Drepanopeziza brunnea f. sp. 'monogermtubi']|nr:hypothetical protein LZ554_004759 [Drepanopeziza brunnea f. sp. 'monogermtubi']
MTRRKSPAHDCLLSPPRPVKDIRPCPNVPNIIFIFYTSTSIGGRHWISSSSHYPYFANLSAAAFFSYKRAPLGPAEHPLSVTTV